MQIKYCPCCKEIKPITEFSTMRVRNGVASHCRSCARELGRKYSHSSKGKEKRKTRYERNKKKLKNAKLLRNFGITLDRYDTILASQDYKCAICGKTAAENKKALAVDHNHVTNETRGLLCSSCNICVGFIEKNHLDFSAILAYLQKYGLSSYSKSL